MAAQATSVDDPQNHYIENNRGYGSYRRHTDLSPQSGGYTNSPQNWHLQIAFHVRAEDNLTKGILTIAALWLLGVVALVAEISVLVEAWGQYLMPCDGTERARLDMMHTLLKAARDKDKRLLDAPFYENPNQTTPQEPHRVLDLGCGTGIWCLDMAAKYRNTHFVGVDLYNLGPKDLLSNVDLRAPFDYENPWAIGESSWDVIHLQMALGSVMDWPKLYQKIVRHLKPGGWFEHVEIDWQPRCDDGTMPATGRLADWWENRIAPAYDAISRRLRYREETQLELSKAGFTNIQHRVYRIPLGGWSSDRAEFRSGTWWNLSMSSGPDYGCGIEALSLAALTRMHEWPAEHARRFCEEVLMEARNPAVHAYNNLHIWWANGPAR